MAGFDRSPFATTPEELDIQEAICALERALSLSPIKGSTRVSLRMALDALRSELR